MPVSPSAPAVIGGMLTATVLAVFFIPLFFVRAPGAEGTRPAATGKKEAKA
jgi:Cu/Ag efflux pump CusA